MPPAAISEPPGVGFPVGFLINRCASLLEARLFRWRPVQAG
jgi:hypothetical protein